VDGAGVLQGMVTDRDLRSACPSTMLNEAERQEIFNRVGRLTVSSIMSRESVSLEVTFTTDVPCWFRTGANRSSDHA